MRPKFFAALALALVVVVSAVSPASALTVDQNGRKGPIEDYYWYYASQDTRRSENTNLDYYGYRGVKGHMYWMTNGYNPDTGDKNHMLACLSVKMPTSDSDGGSWCQTGLWRQYGWPSPLLYYEDFDAGFQELDFGAVVSAPHDVFTKVTFTGDNTWNGRKEWFTQAGGLTMYFDHDSDRGKATAQGEIQKKIGSTIPEPPIVYFGTDQAGYHGTDNALYIKNGQLEYELWDESITAGTTLAWSCPAPVDTCCL